MESSENAITIEQVENMKVGERIMSFTSVYLSEEDCHKIADRVPLIFQKSHSLLSLTFQFVRLIVFTNDMHAANRYWRQTDGSVAELTDNEHGTAVAKCFTWGDGSVERTFSVIIISDACAWLMLHGSEQQALTMNKLLLHEVGHIFPDFIMGLELKRLKSNAYESILIQLAFILWSEFYAEYQSYSNLEVSPVVNLEQDIELTLNLAKFVRETIEDAITKRINHTNLSSFWSMSVEQVSILVAQIGRMMGAFAAIKTQTSDSLHLQLKDVSHKWPLLLSELQTCLTLEFKGLDELNPVSGFCRRVFELYRIRAKDETSGTYIEIIES